MSRISLTQVFVFALVACGGGREEPRPAPAASAAPAPAAAAPARAPTPDISRARIDALLESWLTAQNTGRFDAYSSLYAERFQGVRRSGEKTKRFDRAGWLADRQRMFARPMTVAISDVTVAATGNTANVRFTQRYSSGRYSDEGPKRMLLVAKGETLEIASEEMLASRATRAASTSGVYLTHELRRGTLIVLGPAEDAFATGAPELVDSETEHVALRAVTSAVPAFATALVGKTVKLVGEHTCDATLDALAVAAIVVPHFGTVQEWEGEDFDDDTPNVQAPPAQVASDVYDLADQRWLVARTSAQCSSRLAVTGTTLPVIFEARAASDTVRAQIARDVVEGEGGEESLDAMRHGLELESTATVTDANVLAALYRAITVTEHTNGSTTVVVARMEIPGECGGSVQSYVYTQQGSRFVRTEAGGTYIPLVVDLERDGAPEIVVENGSAFWGLYALGALATPLTEWSRTYLDCDC